MFQYKTVIGLILVGLALMGIVLLLTSSEDDDGAASDTQASKQHPRAAAPTSADATGRPTPPQAALTEKAEHEGIDAVRSEFHSAVKQRIDALVPAREKPFNPGSGSPLTARAGDITSWSGTWAHLEARAIFRGSAVPEDFDEIIWKPLFDAAIKSRTAFLDTIADLEQSREERIHVDDPETGETIVDPRELERYQGDLRRIRLQHDTYSGELFVKLAELAKIAGRPDLVQQVYKAYDAPLPKHGAGHARIGELKSAEEFMQYEHEVFQKKYGHSMPPPPEPPVPESKFSVTEEEQKAIRNMVKDLWNAFIAQDKEKMLSFAADQDVKRLEDILDEELSEGQAFSYDWTNARFRFFRDEEDGPVTVHVHNVGVDEVVFGKRRKAQTSSTYRIVFRNGQPKIQFLKEKQP